MLGRDYLQVGNAMEVFRRNNGNGNPIGRRTRSAKRQGGEIDDTYFAVGLLFILDKREV